MTFVLCSCFHLAKKVGIFFSITIVSFFMGQQNIPRYQLFSVGWVVFPLICLVSFFDYLRIGLKWLKNSGEVSLQSQQQQQQQVPFGSFKLEKGSRKRYLKRFRYRVPEITSELTILWSQFSFQMSLVAKHTHAYKKTTLFRLFKKKENILHIHYQDTPRTHNKDRRNCFQKLQLLQRNSVAVGKIPV